MYWKIVKKDLSQSKFSSLILISLIVLASFLICLSVMMLVDLEASIDEFLEKSQTPHFMQMYYGELHRDEIENFASSNELVEDFQILEMTNIDGSDIVLAGRDLSDNVQDNGVVSQSASFDYILDMDNQILYPNKGEVYLPLSYRELAGPGDKARIGGRDFLVAGYLRDSQMNSNLSSSKRFLVHEHD